jgi:AcrR family transcriptional regulator
VARHSSISDAELLNRLSAVFRDVGYAGASLAELSAATGLKRASLYHRFPGGKEQMAQEVLRAAGEWIGDNVLSVLKSDAPPRARIVAMAAKLKAFYSGGKQACLLNMLSSAHIHNGPFTKQIKAMFQALIDGLSAVLIEAGYDEADAASRAERAVILLQGSLVLSRGTGSTRPFQTFLSTLPDELFGRDRQPAEKGGKP